MAFVVVQHLDPTHKGMMVELLQRATPMPVVQVKDRLRVEPDRVYVIPPNKDLSILHGVLHLLAPAAPRGLRLPIDFFFRSLADDQQGPEHRRHPLGHGLGRHAGPPGHQGEGGRGLRAGAGLGQVRRHAAQRHRRRAGRRRRPGRGAAGQDRRLSRARAARQPARAGPGEARPQSAIEKICVLLRSQTGHDFSLYKKSTVYRRIERRMGLHQIDKHRRLRPVPAGEPRRRPSCSSRSCSSA